VIICHCGVVTDRAVTGAIEAGARTLSQVCRASGAAQLCGDCVFSVKQILCQHGVVGMSLTLEVAGGAD
jgi:bacterioferritin-associated ferredoxin